jgi:hypothetical protein
MEMSNTCQISFNNTLNRWEAVYQGKVLASTKNIHGGVDYLRKVIECGLSVRAKNLRITACQVSADSVGVMGGTVADNGSIDDELQTEPVPSIESEFSINERFDILSAYTEMVGRYELASALITGDGGLGKSFTVMKALANIGLQDINQMEIGAKFDGARGYIVIKGYSTPKGLYRTLYENRNQIVIFDDCDSVLKDANAVNILKSALDSYDVRRVTWNAETTFGYNDEDLPKSFEFTGGVIFISNMSMEKVPAPIRSRAMCADVSMTRDEMIERMHTIVRSAEFMPETPMEHKTDAMDFIEEHANNPLISKLNLRTLVNVTKSRGSRPDNWKRIALYSMANN